MGRLLRRGFTACLILISLHLSGQVQCDNDSTGLIPIQDLLTDYYMGTWQGGLYPGGVNTIPTAHLIKAAQMMKKLKPLDTLGVVNYDDGKIVLAGFGASTVGGPFNHMINLMKDYNDMNPCFKAVNAANGSDGITAMSLGNDEYFDYIDEFKLGEKGLEPIQVQVGWLMHNSRTDSNGTDINSYVDTLIKRFTASLNALIYYYPNLKVLFISGFPYGGYADPMKVLYHIIHEPVSYHHNFAVKELIGRQIMGDPTLRFKEPDRQAPLIVWGPPLWADGMNPNNYDGLTWNCETEFSEDGGGYHLTNLGKDKLAGILLDFFRTGTLTKGWVMDGPKWDLCGGGRIMNDNYSFTDTDLLIYPNPSSGELYADINEVFAGSAEVKVFNHLGDVIFEDHYEPEDAYSAYRFSMEGQPPGIYYFSIVMGNSIKTEPFILH
jgi:hypothetical protein